MAVLPPPLMIFLKKGFPLVLNIIISRKPLVVTCSKDRTIRVWNYLTKGMELAKKFREELFRLVPTLKKIYCNLFQRRNPSGWIVLSSRLWRQNPTPEHSHWLVSCSGVDHHHHHSRHRRHHHRHHHKLKHLSKRL